MKYLKLFENWNKSQGDGFHFYYDSTTLEFAEDILRFSFKPVELSSEEIKKFEEALKKYLKADISELKLEEDRYKGGNKYSWQIIPTSGVGSYDLGHFSRAMKSRNYMMSCWLEKFEDEQYLLKLECIPVPKDEYKLGLVIHNRFGYIINGLDNLDLWVKASPIDTKIEAYKCLGSKYFQIYRLFSGRWGQLKLYAPLGGMEFNSDTWNIIQTAKSRDNKGIEKLNKILENYSFIQDYDGKNNYLFGNDHQQLGIIEDLTLRVADVKDIEMVSEKTGIPMDDFDIYKYKY